eukprot:TRINITY_DN7191_c0_g1_i1.p1 TRINITY_DN7191_c0_g1~~TRINITY_DN7191_c0_g1_i1.p1  ORF type:complete len:903 (+),score=374.26 TRINITY_DN7191_c0_g1_i1:53-2710(+)
MSGYTTAQMKDLFLNEVTTFADHLDAITSNPELYKVQMLMLLELIDFPKNTKTRCLLAALQAKQFDFANVLLQHKSYGFAEVFAACKALDGKRRLKSWKASLRDFEAKGSQQCSPNKKAKPDPDTKEPSKDEKEAEVEAKAHAHDISALVAEEEAMRSRAKGGKGKKGAVAHRHVRGAALTGVWKGGKGMKGAKGKGGKRGKDLKRKREDEEPRWLRRRAAKIATLKSDIGSLENAIIEELTATMSGSMCKRFQAWVKKIKRGTLMHFLLEFGLEPWQEFLDIIHINPKDLQLPEFAPCVYDPKKKRPATVEYSLKLTNDTLQDVVALKKNHVPLTYLRKKFKMARVPNKVKAAITEYTDINTLVWWYEELQCSETDKILEERITKKCEVPTFGYGKLMERLMSMHASNSPIFQCLVPAAEERLKGYHLPLKTPLAVLGDCSGSMHVAVRAGSIIVSLLTALGSADLLFFNHKAIDPLFVPTTIKDVLMLSHFTKADGATSPASALERLYLARNKVETLLLVSDEEENEPSHIMQKSFTQLMKKYMEDVNKDVKVVLVSFLPSKPDPEDLRPAEQQLNGQMYLDLVEAGITPLQVRIDGNRPDLTKVDFLLGRLSSESKGYEISAELLMLMMSWVPLATVAELLTSLKALGNEFVYHLVSTAVKTFVGLEPCGEKKPDKAVLPDLSRIIKSAVDAKLVGMLDVKALEQQLRDGDVAALKKAIDTWVPLFGGDEAKERDAAAERKVVVAKLQEQKSLAVEREDYNEAQKLKVQIQHLERAPVNVVSGYGNTGMKICPDTLKRVLEYLPETDLKRCCRNVSKSWRYLSLEVTFDMLASKKDQKWHDLIPTMEAFGFVDQFGVEKCLWALDRNRGNVERAIGSLFGEE